MWKFILKIRVFIKKLFNNEVFETALKEGKNSWDKVDQEFEGPLSKEKYQDENGEWTEHGEGEYQLEKEARQKMWFDLTKKVLMVAFPQYSGYTSLLFIVLGHLGLDKKL